ncbi:MAG: NUDIX hydrolase [Calditrichia bacterium]|nr:NUDIX hydrolase [Calditrichia bacterium]
MYTYKYPRPMVTVDIILFRFFKENLEILLIQRKNNPFKEKWALPGGFIEMNEPLLEAAKRELKEETAVDNIKLFELKTFGKPGRDPRGRTITVLYGGIINDSINIRAGDDAKNINWFNINKLPELAFDHNEVINVSRAKLFEQFILKNKFFNFFDDEISTAEIKKLVSSLLNIEKNNNQIEDIINTIPFIKIDDGKIKILNSIIVNLLSNS